MPSPESFESDPFARALGHSPEPLRPAALRAEEFDPLAPQREAALFYGMFLRGHSPVALRRDIDVPKKLLDKLMLRHRNELPMKEKIQRSYAYRKQVLAIFDELVTRKSIQERVH
ncbi:MAG: hypothetical protein ABI824_11740 [Acidobacteriota bacterium]